MKCVVNERRFAFWIFLLLFSGQGNCQVLPLFDQLNLSEVSSGFLYPQILAQPMLPNTLEDQLPISARESLMLVSRMDKACLDSTSYIDDFESYYVQLKTSALNTDCRAICIMDLKYHDFKPNALQDSLIYFENNKFYDHPDASSSPWTEKETLILWIDASVVPKGATKFILQHQGYISNREYEPTSIEIDFDDGLGYRLLLFDTPIEVEYDQTDAEKVIKVKIEGGNGNTIFGKMKSNSNAEYDPCESTIFPFPNTPLWPTDCDGSWCISTEYENITIKGNAYVLNSNDNVFDKPFIFVEGIDFGINDYNEEIHETFRNGTFGWCQFTSGFVDQVFSDDITYDYEMLKKMPEILEELRIHGYDIVLLDFYDGADYMERNSALLRKLIQLCNEYKSGNESLIVAGASMGGQVSRHALSTFEAEGVDHCTRLWISMDSPHCGANIPVSLQYAIDFLVGRGSIEAINFKYNYLLRPAARQLLNSQVFSDLNLRNEWYQNLDFIGFPNDCKSVAISNGKADGVGIYQNGSPLLNWNCAEGLSSPLKIMLHHSAGDPDASIIEDHNLIMHMRMPSFGYSNFANEPWSFTNFLPGLGLGWGNSILLDLVDIEEQKRYVPEGTPNWDDAAGGTRTSIADFVIGLNRELEDLGIDNVCSTIDLNSIKDKHSFISTASSMGINSADPELNINQFLATNPGYNGFDNWIFANFENEQHVEVTSENVDFILHEVLGWEYSGLENELTASSANMGIFNYSKRSFSEIKDIWIHDGGTLHFNANMPTHFSDSGDNWNQAGHKSFSTALCSPATIHISNNGIVNIGDQFNPSYTAEVHLYRDSKLVVNTDGLLRINAGSKLVIHEGAELTLEDGCQLEVNNGRIEVLSGGMMNVSGIGLTNNSLFSQNETVHSLKLNGHDACISFDNGKLQVIDNVTLQFDTSVDETGYIEILPGSENTLLTDVGSKVIFNGKNQDDVVLRINDYAHLQNANFGLGSLEFRNCKIDLNNHGAIFTDMPTTIDRVAFVANEMDVTHNGRIVVWYTTCHVKNSSFNQVKVQGMYTKLMVSESEFNGGMSGVYADNGAYEINHCDFNLGTVQSEGLQSASSIQTCHFEGGIDSQVQDESLVELIVKGNLFGDASEFGIEKIGGKLSASCNTFANVYGLKVEDGELNMSSNNGAGYNVFNQTDYCIVIENAASVDLMDGYNDFSGFQYHNIKGTINMPCGGEESCFSEINARGNCWGYTQSEGSFGIPDQLIQPDPEHFDVTTTIVVPCAGYENTNACSVVFYDQSPMYPDNCPEKVKLVVGSYLHSKAKSASGNQAKSNTTESINPVLNTINFQGIELDSALVYAAMMSEAYDSLGNDLMAIELLHEILTSGLDFYNMSVRSKMNWARYVMKSAVERMFLDGELHEFNNVVAFELPVQLYVDVLNLMTDTALTDSTYRDQFYLELDKGQLFRTIGNRETALTVFAHLGDCQLDSLEQITLYEWSTRTENELDVVYQYIVQNIPADSIQMPVDSMVSSTMFHIDVSDYYFGLWIDSPQSVTFVTCGADPVYRDLWSSPKVYGVFPNPSENLVNIVGLDKDAKAEVQLWDLQGRRVHSAQISPNSSVVYWPFTIATGTYTLRIVTHDSVEDHLMMITR
jgi:hypothetical protein